MISLTNTLSDLVTKSVHSAIPEITEQIAINSDKGKDWHYSTPSAIKIFNMNKKNKEFPYKTCKELAEKMAESIPLDTVIEKVELLKVGKGDEDKSGFFINIYLKISFMSQQLKYLANHDVEYKAAKPIKIGVDFSSPNIAKNMHVGHLRSTIIGDSLCRILEFLGHDVVRINHIGDWGTQFGMLICHMQDNYPDFLKNPPDISDLDGFYKEAKNRFDTEEEFKNRARDTVVKFQSGSEEELEAWKMICEVSRQQFFKIYKRLDIVNKEYGESFYNEMIPPLIKRLEDMGVITEDQGCK